jgi:hypothetical protein
METRDKKRIIKTVGQKESLSNTATVEKIPSESFWKNKTLEELVKAQNVAPVKDEADFLKRYWGGLEDWDDMDDFLNEVHRPWK